MKEDLKIEKLLDKWEEGNMSVKDLSDEMYKILKAKKTELRKEFIKGYQKGCDDTHDNYNEIVTL